MRTLETAIQKLPRRLPVQKSGTAFRFFDNREKYLMFVTTCSEKWVIAKRLSKELRHISPVSNALYLFDAGLGDGTVLSHVMRALHRRFTHVPWVVVGKEISMEDVRLSLGKMADRFCEHPELVFVITNLKYKEAPTLMPSPPSTSEDLNWHEMALEGDTSEEFEQQIRTLNSKVTHGWQVKTVGKSGNLAYVRPSVVILYRKDREFTVGPLIPQPGKFVGAYDLIIASQPYRARVAAEFKVMNVLAPLAKAIAPGGRMVAIQSCGRDPGMEIVNRIWPDENPFSDGRQKLLNLTKDYLCSPDNRNLRYLDHSDKHARFRYHLHTMPSEVQRNIGTSTGLAAWNAAIYVAQIEDKRLEQALEKSNYLDIAREVVFKHGGLWFNDEAFVIARPRTKHAIAGQ